MTFWLFLISLFWFVFRFRPFQLFPLRRLNIQYRRAHKIEQILTCATLLENRYSKMMTNSREKSKSWRIHRGHKFAKIGKGAKSSKLWQDHLRKMFENLNFVSFCRPSLREKSTRHGRRIDNNDDSWKGANKTMALGESLPWTLGFKLRSIIVRGTSQRSGIQEV